MGNLPEQPHPAPPPPRFPVIPPRLVSRGEAAAYCRIGATTFDKLVQMELMPRPKAIGTRRVWDLRQIDGAIDELPEAEIQNPANTPCDPFLDVAA
jgi:predicted DNA-binding transcriptional regulator AlpA